MIYIIEDDEIMAECIARACGDGVQIFGNAIEAMQAIDEGANVGRLPDLIFLDVLLTGPDGFTFLHELMSYDDTSKIPIVMVTSLNLAEKDLSVYGVVEVLDKNTMRPEDIGRCVTKYTSKDEDGAKK